MAQNDKAKLRADVFTQAIENPNIPKVYINGFTIGSTNADVAVVAQQNAQPIAVLNMSYGIAKTLVEKLGSTVSQLEETTGTSFLTTDDIDKHLTSASKKKSKK